MGLHTTAVLSYMSSSDPKTTRQHPVSHVKLNFSRLKSITGRIITMDKVMEILKDIRPDVDFENETKLIDDDILDSFDIISIVGEFNDAFDIEINVEDLEPENFNTVGAMFSLIQKLQEEA